MALPPAIAKNLTVPAILAPMFLASGPDLVVECCRSGLVGSFPALNQRSTDGLRQWLTEIETRLNRVSAAAPFAVNLVVHRTNSRLAGDLEAIIQHKVPIVITSLGASAEVIAKVHDYGGVIYHDVINRRHAEKAAAAKADGIIAVAAGAGGHAGTLSPFALLAEIRQFFNGTLILAGAISTGNQIAAARAAGADLAYLGTRFLATKEALIPDAQKSMILDSQAADIVYTKNISGVHANFLRASIIKAGMDPDNIPDHGSMDMEGEAKVWKDIWSAGHGVGSIDQIPAAATLCKALAEEYRATISRLAADPYRFPRSANHG